MARYIGLFKVAASDSSLQSLLSSILESCSLNIIYQAGDYLMAREIPGKVTYPQLVTVEVLIDKSQMPDQGNHLNPQEIQMNIVIKNEELPLQADNHCRQMFNQVSQAIIETQHWDLIEAVAS